VQDRGQKSGEGEELKYLKSTQKNDLSYRSGEAAGELYDNQKKVVTRRQPGAATCGGFSVASGRKYGGVWNEVGGGGVQTAERPQLTMSQGDGIAPLIISHRGRMGRG